MSQLRHRMQNKSDVARCNKQWTVH